MDKEELEIVQTDQDAHPLYPLLRFTRIWNGLRMSFRPRSHPGRDVLSTERRRAAGRVGVALLWLSVAIGCKIVPFGDDLENPDGAGRLTVANDTTSILDFVCWVSQDGTSYYFEPDTVFDEWLNQNVGGMNPGSEATVDVHPGSSPVYFFFTAGGNEWWTQSPVTVRAGETVRFRLTDDTPVRGSEVSGKLAAAGMAMLDVVRAGQGKGGSLQKRLKEAGRTD